MPPWFLQLWRHFYVKPAFTCGRLFDIATANAQKLRNVLVFQNNSHIKTVFCNALFFRVFADGKKRSDVEKIISDIIFPA